MQRKFGKLKVSLKKKVLVHVEVSFISSYVWQFVAAGETPFSQSRSRESHRLQKTETSALTRIRGSRVQTIPITLWETTTLDCSATDGCSISTYTESAFCLVTGNRKTALLTEDAGACLH